MYRGVESWQGIDTPGVAELPWGDKNPGVNTEGEGLPGEYRRGRRGDRNPSTAQATEARGAGGRDNERTGRPGTAVPPRLHRGTSVEGDSKGTLRRHTAGTYGAKPEHGALARCEYSLLAPTGPAVNPAAVGGKGRRYSHKATREMSDQA